MICELCGGDAPFLKDTVIEGTRLMVCPSCSRMGTAHREEPKEVPSSIMEERLQRRVQRSGHRDIYRDQDEALAEDYPERIFRARERMGLTREEMGLRINEKSNIIGKLENGTLRPDDTLRKKLEKFLNISLREKVQEGIMTGRGRSKGLTLGDLIRIQQEKEP